MEYTGTLFDGGKQFDSSRGRAPFVTQNGRSNKNRNSHLELDKLFKVGTKGFWECALVNSES